MNPIQQLHIEAGGTLARGAMNLEVRMVAGTEARVFRVYPTGAIGELQPWPNADPIVVSSSVPSVASAVVGQDFHSAVVTPLAPGTSLVELHAAGQVSYINVTVVAAQIDHLQVEETV